MLRIIVSILVIVLVIAAIGILASGIQDTSVESYRVTDVRIDDALLIEGVLTLHNPSRLPVPVEAVPYTVSSDGGVLSTGSLSGFVLAPGTSETDLTMRIATDSVRSLLATRSGRITINGTIDIAVPFVPPLAFSDEHDLLGGSEQDDDADGGSTGIDDVIGGLV